MARTKHIILIGLKASGKTTIGKQLAGDCKRRFFDIDKNIIDLYRKNNPIFGNQQISSEQVYGNVGAEVYSAYELLAIEQAFGTLTNRRGILAVSCGTLHNEQHLKYLRQHGKFFYLRGSYRLLFPRWLMTEPVLNYIADDVPLFKQYFQQQDAFLNDIADIILDLDSLSTNDCLSSLKTCSQKNFWHKHFSKTKKSKKSKKMIKKALLYTEPDSDQNRL